MGRGRVPVGTPVGTSGVPLPAPLPRADELPIRCMHGALPGDCAFVGCASYRPDGPRDEQWSFHPGTTPGDIQAALAENAAQHARAVGSASPIHLVVERYRRKREGC